MDVLHLEFDGKTARIPVRSLPSRVKPSITYKSSVGNISSVFLRSGVTPTLDVSQYTYKDFMDADPEISLQSPGELVDRESLSTTYYNPADPKPESDFEIIDVVYAADGSEKQRRPHLVRQANINTIHPIKITRQIPLAEALTSFVFKQTHQLVHEDGLMRDFLFKLAQELHQSQTLALLGAGQKGNQPLIVRDKGNPYRAFLFGEIGKGEHEGAYKLLLLLSDQELKLPEA